MMNESFIEWDFKEDVFEKCFNYYEEAAWEDLASLEEVDGTYLDAIFNVKK